MGEKGAARYRVRRIARRRAPTSSPSMMTHGRAIQLRLIGLAAFLCLAILALLYRKAAVRYGDATPARVLGALVALPVIAFLVRQRRGAKPAPVDSESTISTPGIEGELRDGTLSPGDLVLEGEHWTTLMDSVRFGDVAGEAHARLRRADFLQMAVLVVLGVAGAILLLATLANTGNIIMWLIAD
ncbi:hypothetical protein JGU66_30205 [Myxococcaceae bacterium JPH2]|nr:hypothetical protein [Myxococcaceae bacterium JPH2]